MRKKILLKSSFKKYCIFVLYLFCIIIDVLLVNAIHILCMLEPWEASPSVEFAGEELATTRFEISIHLHSTAIEFP
jgi:hypothetical protein